MRASAIVRIGWVGLVALAACACTQDARRARGQGARGSGAPEQGSPDAPPAGGASSSPSNVVNLSDDDLVPVHSYIRQRRYLLGDEAEVVASKEFFVQNLMIATSRWGVAREDRETPDGAVITLTWLGAADAATVTTAPRVMIGTGIEVLARKRLVVRFVPTRDPNVPIRLLVTASGRASTGAADRVERRADRIAIGGTLRRDARGAWRFDVLAN